MKNFLHLTYQERDPNSGNTFTRALWVNVSHIRYILSAQDSNILSETNSTDIYMDNGDVIRTELPYFLVMKQLDLPSVSHGNLQRARTPEHLLEKASSDNP